MASYTAIKHHSIGVEKINRWEGRTVMLFVVD